MNVIWQRDANAIALRALADAAAPPFVVNVTGRPAVRVRDLALAFGHRRNVEPVFTGVEVWKPRCSRTRRRRRRSSAPIRSE
ncbi:MAG: hypothetical protein R2882_10745 [Gemmatimonadales bacterium]